MVYSQLEIARRLKSLLPARWFGHDTPVLDSVLNGLAAGWVAIFCLSDYARKQARVASASDFWLDLVAMDFFGPKVARRARETDGLFRGRIIKELRRDRCTRIAIAALLQDLAGRPSKIFEPANPYDTGCYASLSAPGDGLGSYGSIGGWGNLNIPFQVFVTMPAPETSPGISMINGWNQTAGAFGAGLSAYSSAQIDTSRPSGSEIYQEICRIAPVGTIVWVAVEP